MIFLDLLFATIMFILGLFLIYSGWLRLYRGNFTIPLFDRIGIWIARKIIGNEVADKRQLEILKASQQKKIGVGYIIVGMSIVIQSLYLVYKTL